MVLGQPRASKIVAKWALTNVHVRVSLRGLDDETHLFISFPSPGSVTRREDQPRWDGTELGQGALFVMGLPLEHCPKKIGAHLIDESSGAGYGDELDCPSYPGLHVDQSRADQVRAKVGIHTHQQPANLVGCDLTFGLDEELHRFHLLSVRQDQPPA